MSVLEDLKSRPVSVVTAGLLLSFYLFSLISYENAHAVLPLIVANTFMGNFFVWYVPACKIQDVHVANQIPTCVCIR